MNQYLVSARKYRPANFSSVVGQQSLTATLKNAIASDRLAHAYLFCGGRGVGKTSCARIFAKTINCTNRSPQGEACEVCDSCLQFNQGRSLNILELDAASHNGVDDIKSLIEQVMVPPTTGRYRVFIIDEVHMLSPAAFNAFLKTLEEPPSHAIFILATTEKHKILPTILSRCQIYDFNRISIADMVAHMQSVAANEGIKAEPEALSVIARKADGAMRDALSIFDQVAAFTQGNITYRATIENLNVLDRAIYNRLIDAIIAGDIPAALMVYKEVRDRGFDSQFFINGLGQHLRDLMVAASPATAELIEAPESERSELAERARKLHPTVLYKAMEICNDADFNFRAATNKQFLVELALIKLCQRFSPSSENSGDDEGRLQPLKAASPTAAAETLSAAPVTHPAQPVTNLTPHAPSARAAAAPAATTLRIGNIRLSSVSSKAEKVPADEKPVQQGPREAPCSEADLISAWKALPPMIVANPMLRSVVEVTSPTVVAPLKIRLTLASSVQADLVEAGRHNILELLRNKLKNDSVDFEIIVDDTNLEPAYWPEKRVLEYMLNAHPLLGEYMTKFKMRIV